MVLIFAFVINDKKGSNTAVVELAKMNEKNCPNESMLKGTQFITEKV